MLWRNGKSRALTEERTPERDLTGWQVRAMQVLGGEHSRQRDRQCKSPGVGMRLRVWETARKMNFREQLGGPKPPQQSGLSLEGPLSDGL